MNYAAAVGISPMPDLCFGQWFPVQDLPIWPVESRELYYTYESKGLGCLVELHCRKERALLLPG